MEGRTDQGDHQVWSQDDHRGALRWIQYALWWGKNTSIQRYDLPSSHKLAPFRTHTLPYTGPLDPKREDPLQKYSTYLKDFSKIVNNTKESVKPTIVNQFIRGELFIAADYIITKRYFETNFTEANNFLIGYIKEGAKLTNLCGEYLKEVQRVLFEAWKIKFRLIFIQCPSKNRPFTQSYVILVHLELNCRQ